MKRLVAPALLATLGLPAPARAQDAAAAFRSACAVCHGFDGKKRGDLGAIEADEATVARWIAGGIPEKKMPAFKGKLADDEIQALAHYVKTGLR